MAQPGNSRSLRCLFLLAALLALSSARWKALQAKPGDEAAKPDVPALGEATEASPDAPATPKSPEATPPPRTGGDLPWVKKKTKSDALPILRPPASVREIMEKYDIGDSQLEGFFAGQPLTPSEEDVLIRILFRLPRIGIENIHKWRKPELQLDQLVADPSHHRLEVIPLKGRLVGVEQRDVAPELAARLEIKQYYLARIKLVGLGYEAIVAIRRVPQYWLETPELDEPVNLDGMYLKVLEGTAEEPQLLFVARRIQWRPDRPIPEMDIGADQLRLAELGLDLSLLEDLKQSNRRELGDLDREPQYQLLDLVGRVPASKLVPDPPKDVDVVALLKEPEKHHGELMSVHGFAQRITKIVVEDPDIRARFGITHYYEIYIGVNLGDKTIRIVDDPKRKKPAAAVKQPVKQSAEKPEGESAEKLEEKPAEKPAEKKDAKKDAKEEQVFNNDYPVTICVRELGEGLEPADHMRDKVHVNGIFMKTWAYRSQQLARSPNKMQVAPLFVGKIAHRVVPEKVYNRVSDVLVGFAMVAAALIVGSVIWWFRGTEVSARDSAKHDAETGVRPSFAGLENVPTKPDFSGLEKSASEPNADTSPPPR